MISLESVMAMSPPLLFQFCAMIVVNSVRFSRICVSAENRRVINRLWRGSSATRRRQSPVKFREGSQPDFARDGDCGRRAIIFKTPSRQFSSASLVNSFPSMVLGPQFNELGRFKIACSLSWFLDHCGMGIGTVHEYGPNGGDSGTLIIQERLPRLLSFAVKDRAAPLAFTSFGISRLTIGLPSPAKTL